MNKLSKFLSEYYFYIKFMRSDFLKHYGIVKTLKGIAFFHYRKIKQLFLDIGSEKVFSVNGYKITTIPNDRGISTELSLFNTHEPLSTMILKKTVEKDMFCIDVGANIGYYTFIQANEVGENGKVIACEPSSLNYSYLKKNLQLNQLSNVSSYNIALSDKSGTSNLLIHPTKSNLNKISNSVNTNENFENVKTLTLDELCNKLSLKKVNLIRMDVEGHELQIMKGSIKTIKKFKPLIFMEIHTPYLNLENSFELLNMLKSNGYEIDYLIPRDLDYPFLGTEKDIKKITIDEIVYKLKEGNFPIFFAALFKSRIEP